MTGTVLTMAGAAAFALIHVLIGRMAFLDVVPRSRWLSFAGGVAVAYVFLHILPELTIHQEMLAEHLGVNRGATESWLYVVALVGLTTFYGLERVIRARRRSVQEPSGNRRAVSRVFWLHIGSFGLYNVLAGYLLLHREEAGRWSIAAYCMAMAMHFITSDFGLRKNEPALYDRAGRWILAAAVATGLVLGVAIDVPRVAVGFLFAFLAGAVVLNVMKEELPEERESRFWPFAAGCAAYGGLLLAA